MAGTASEGKPLDIISAFQAYGDPNYNKCMTCERKCLLGEYVSGKITDDERVNIVSGIKGLDPNNAVIVMSSGSEQLPRTWCLWRNVHCEYHGKCHRSARALLALFILYSCMGANHKLIAPIEGRNLF